MTPGDLIRMAINELEAAESCMDVHDADGAIAHALLSIAASLRVMTVPSSVEIRR